MLLLLLLLLQKGAWTLLNQTSPDSLTQHEHQLALGSACPCLQSAAYSRVRRCKDGTSIAFFMALYVDASKARQVHCGVQGSACNGGMTFSVIEVNSSTPRSPSTQTL